MKFVIIFFILLFPTIAYTAPSNLQLYLMQQNQMLDQTYDDMQRDMKMNRLQSDMEDLQNRQQSNSNYISTDTLLLLILKNNPELLKKLQK